MKTSVGFEKWFHRAEDESFPVVFPDGCRDVLIVRRKGEPAKVVFTEFDHRPRRAALTAGTEITGYRLRPGACIEPDALDALALEPEAAAIILTRALAVAAEIDEAIMALTKPHASLRRVSADLGVSPRTLQRRFRHLALPGPDYWRLLARARRAVAMLALPASLADIAGECGYSDQAHMTREFARWFGATPHGVRRNKHLFRLLSQPALGNWIGEQISTR
ncbi:AraC family transcriptional regulator [Consotaella salsifontis]|uniref:Transcriptional regulator, AraC family n=1 Tax=Consotaella salsifontis TaxID=1365950 RepID=A0A1T4NT35_9HYPH|nr:helix-turn-helix domain-containing protein [Consotaella salsifontis]SJZ82394.1 transcriptional regulator, AraC family [Consotaella salsifontis]